MSIIDNNQISQQNLYHQSRRQARNVQNTNQAAVANNQYQFADHSPDFEHFDNFFAFLFKYLRLRLRQFIVIFQLLGNAISSFTVNSKGMLVRKMYWGRTSFYKTAFHITVIIITTLSLVGGLGQRIVTTQQKEIQYLSVSARTVVDSDMVTQQGSKFPLQELDEYDSAYFDYVVQAGDSLEKIANDNGINADTLRWSNGIESGRDTLKVGQTIRIPVMNGVLYEVKSGDTVDKVLSKVKLQDQEADKLTFLELNAKFIDAKGNLIPGSVVFIPEATIEAPKPTPKPRSSSSSSSGSRVVDTGAATPQAPPGRFVNPMQLTSYKVSRGYSYNHTGVDWTTSVGSWVVAAGAGTVSHAGWCYSLGYCVVIKHANGYSTIAGHGNGVLAVRSGQGVVAGQKIMQSGCTGRCYGPHVHFSLAANGQDVFGCYRCRINPYGIVPY